MKKLIILLLMVCVFMSFAFPAFASDNISVYVDNQLLQLEDPPIIQNGRTLAPMRGIFEALGASVDWEADTQTAIGRRGDITVRIPIGSTRPTINNRIESINVPAQIINGRTYIPLRFVGEALGDDVQWDGATRSITITRTEGKDKEKHDHEKPIQALDVWIEVSPEPIPEGGGQPVNIIVTVADNFGYLVEGAHVRLDAEAFEAGGRNGQLSQLETTTDAMGQARVTYTTLAADDHRFVSIGVSASKDHLMEHISSQLVAANRVARVSGIVSDPFTGAPLKGVHIHFGRYDSDRRSIGFVETDAEGRYTATVPIGHYGLSFDLQIRDEIAVNISTPGETYTVNNNKGILRGVVTGVSPGNKVMAIGPGFRSTNLDNWTLQADIKSDGSFVMALFPNTYELVIVGRSNPFKTGVTVRSGQVTDLGSVSAGR